MNTPPFDRDALTALIAVQMNMIGREDLAAAIEAHLADPRRPFLETLQEHGTLTAAHRAALDPVVERLLGRIVDSAAAHEPMLSQGAEGPMLSGFEGSAASVASGRRAAAASPRETSLDEAEDSRPLIAGRFRILDDEPHAQGGLGRVWRARDEQLGRIVALKEIRDDKAHDPSHRARFLLEAEINGGLEHPGIVPVYDRGESRDGCPFYAMRFIEGDDLHQVIESRRRENPRLDPNSIEIRTLLTRFLEICRAIDYAHGRGVVHRDIKPRNIMLGPYGEAVIIDWGLAKAAGRADGDLESIPLVEPPSAHELDATRVGSRMGTPEYMSPEQAAGETDRIGPLSDVYGLGATLHHLLTGRPPVVGSDRKEVFEKVRRGEIEPLRKLDPRIHPALDAICSKALATRPEDRYASVAKLADDLERHLADESISARRDSMLERMRRSAKRRPRLSGATLAVVASSLIFVVGLSRVQADFSERSRLATELNLEVVRVKEREIQRQYNDLIEAQRQLTTQREELEAAFVMGYSIIEGLLTGSADPLKAVLDSRDRLTELKAGPDRIRARAAVFRSIASFLELSRSPAGEPALARLPKLALAVVKADDELNEAIRLDPEMGLAYLARGQLWDTVREKVESHARLAAVLGVAIPSADRIDRDFNEAVRLLSNCTYVYSGRGHRSMLHGDLESARQDFEKAIVLAEDNDLALLGLARIAAKKSDFERSLRLFLRMMELEKPIGLVLFGDASSRRRASASAGTDIAVELYNSTHDPSLKLFGLACIRRFADDARDTKDAALEAWIDENRLKVWQEAVSYLIEGSRNAGEGTGHLALLAHLEFREESRTYRLSRRILEAFAMIADGEKPSRSIIEEIRQLGEQGEVEIDRADLESLQAALQSRLTTQTPRSEIEGLAKMIRSLKHETHQ